MAASKYARTSGNLDSASQSSKYARKVGQSSTREFTGAEQAVKSMRRAVEKAKEYKQEIVRLREQVDRQHNWLYDPTTPDDDVWSQRKEIHDDRWQTLEQTIGNLTGWVAIHLAEAGRMSAGERNAAGAWVSRLYEIEEWMRAEDIGNVRQYVNDDGEIPF